MAGAQDRVVQRIFTEHERRAPGKQIHPQQRQQQTVEVVDADPLSRSEPCAQKRTDSHRYEQRLEGPPDAIAMLAHVAAAVVQAVIALLVLGQAQQVVRLGQQHIHLAARQPGHPRSPRGANGSLCGGLADQLGNFIQLVCCIFVGHVVPP
ncbi:hypothetical protein D3C85_1098740 [compost metagenome]